ncbi:hypothetical protein ACOSP7_009564 [Xanthoceras sorbifolium]|uniref:Myb-like domain-containing protein n=1 Tax=Xanthoceras sorbifolium TaxID=99658 RepID=A0ABQ8HUV5_9ROSI|nr:hypothetical protein JRO89_XS07G0225600 [Xanthoceras sorbifolium]
MLGGGADPAVLGSSADVSAAAPIGGAHEVGGGEVGSNSGTEEDKGRGDDGGDRSFGGNRWPRQETLALLKIRSDMDQVFRDSCLKGPLWEEVSRKLAELGYNRSAKKCKEKFENVYKYHKRTKEGRTGKSEGKHYKFFDQLEAFDHQNHQPNHRPIHQPPPKPHTPMQTTPPMPWPNIAPTTTAAATAISHINIPSTTNPINYAPPTTNPTISTTPPTHNISFYPSGAPSSFPNNVSMNLFSSSTSSSTASDEETEDVGDNKRKRKWKDFFKRITKQVIRKQEELQDKFLEAIEKREHDRIVREEAWRVQELARINREHEILIQERSTAAAKDAAVIAFLQKIAGQQQNPPQIIPPPVAAAPPPPPPPLAATNLDTSPKPAKIRENNNGVVQSSSRWPKAEIEALIRLRTELSLKYQENGPKGPLWEEISAAMRGLGYNRNAKRCKEKWENINKYFKKMKDSNKKRPEDSKTCPYFSQLEALYREKSKTDQSLGYGNAKPVINTMVPLMVQPEQQWPLQPENVGRDNGDQIQEDEEEEEEEDDDGDGDDDGESEEEYEGGGGYEIVANKAASMGTTGE